MKLSVIIPVYNCKTYLADCLDSVIHQTFRELEVIVIDDGSTDGSSEICDEYALKDKRIRVIHQENKGVSAARNAGIKVMSGELVSFIDADDTLDLDMYDFLISKMNLYDADISHCGYKHIVGDEIRLVHDTGEIYVQNSDEALECLVGGKLFVGSLWNKIIRSELIQGLQFDTGIKINEDILFNFEVFSRAEKTVFSDSAKYNYIAHKESSACFVTPDLKKTSDSNKVNKFIYEQSREKTYRLVAAERYMRSLGGYYRVACLNNCGRADLKKVREQMWKVYQDNPEVGKNMKTTATLMRYAPHIYVCAYKVYDRIRKPNWEV